MGSSFKYDPARRLRLVGVADNADELVLSNGDGDEFYLPITDALRNATTRPIGRPSAAAADAAAKELSPREIQAMLRAGMTVNELAAQHDLERESLEVYATPIIAERDWIARQAQDLEVAAPQLGNHAYETVFGDEPALLGEMVEHRLEAMGLDPDTLEWDAWRAADSTLWTISAQFSLDGLADSSIGDPPPALWYYKLQSKHLENGNHWARVLSEFGPADSPVTSTSSRSFLTSVSDQPSNHHTQHHRESPANRDDSHEELLDVLHARRGQRLGVDEESDDELAAMITRDEEPSVPQRPKLVVSDSSDDLEPEAPPLTAETEIVWSADKHDDLSSWNGQESVAGESTKKQVSNHEAAADETPTTQLPGQTDAFDDMEDDDTGEALKKSEQPSRSRKRPTVPSWDEIIFGTRKDS